MTSWSRVLKTYPVTLTVNSGGNVHNVDETPFLLVHCIQLTAVSVMSQRQGGRPPVIRWTQSMYSLARSSYHRPEYHRPMQPQASPAW
jgi:hypothetical protein